MIRLINKRNQAAVRRPFRGLTAEVSVRRAGLQGAEVSVRRAELRAAGMLAAMEPDVVEAADKAMAATERATKVVSHEI